MSALKHTPGPWLNAGPVGLSTGIIAAGGWIAVVYRPTQTPESEGNAALITAAPDLLAACRIARPRMQHNRVDLSDPESGCWGNCGACLIDRAVAKAEGGV